MPAKEPRLLDHTDHAGPRGPQDNGQVGVSCASQRRPSPATSWVTIDKPADWAKT